VIKTEKMKEKLKEIWDRSDKPVPFKTLIEMTNYSINHENMENSTLQKHLKTILEKDETTDD